MAQHVCTVFDRGCFHCAKSTKTGIENKKTRVSKMIYNYPEIGSLLIQETTTQVEKKPKEFPKKAIKADKPVEVPAVGKQTPSNFYLGNEQPGKLKHCWSGISFIEEKYERDRENTYRANLRIALANRKRWIRVQRTIEKQIWDSQVKKCGPEWYQDLSYKQLTLLESFPDVLKRDSEEKSVSNSRKFIKEMGIVPLPDNNFLRDLLEKCKRDPLYYFDQIRRDICWKENQRVVALRSEKDPISNVEIAKRKYSVSERLLLSAMFTIHLPILLFKLHLILPQFTAKSKTKNILAPLPEEMVSSLPEPKKNWFKSQNPDSISCKNDGPFGIAEPKTLKDDQQYDQDSISGDIDDKAKSRSSLIEVEPSIKMVDVSVQTEIPSSDSEANIPPTQNDATNGKDGKIPEKNEVLNVDKKRNSANIALFNVQGLNEDLESVNESKRSSFDSSDRSSNDSPMGSISLTPSTDYEKVISAMMASIVRVPTDDESAKREKIKECLKNYNIDGLYEIFGIDPQQQREKVEEKAKKNENSMKTETSTNDSASANDQNTSSGRTSVEFLKSSPTETGLETLISNLREAIMKQPKKKHLTYALSILANAGDPLASFPEIQKCPPVMRWYEIRSGIKNKLSENDKDKLLANSRKAWSVLMSNQSTLASQKVPRCTLTSKQLASYTWDKKKWAMTKINTAITNHKRNIRQAMVDDARLLYSTMNDLDYDSKLNTNIRKTFFTYLHASEGDCCV